MKKQFFITAAITFISISSFAQAGWNKCNAPFFIDRVDDIFMVDVQTGYACSGDGQIVKTTDGGTNWFNIRQDFNYFRSVEFINTQKGFVGSFNASDILIKTEDGGVTWTDLSPFIDNRANGGICGLSIPDSNTIYGCGNWYEDSAYIVKSVDGGNNWSFIGMGIYASSLIDMHFLNKDTGFATGRGPLPMQEAVILHTVDGGQSWTYKYQGTYASEYCWKIQHFSDDIYFASLENQANIISHILKSEDGGLNWNEIILPFPNAGTIQGVGFIDSLNGWAGGWTGYSFETNDGGITWDTMLACPFMNRVFKVNDTLLFASGGDIWKYSKSTTGIIHPVVDVPRFAFIKCSPNPANQHLKINVKLLKSTRALILLLDNTGRRIATIDNTDKTNGEYQYQFNTNKLSQGEYFVVLKTHQDQQTVKVVVCH